MIEFRLLGPLEVLRDGTALRVVAPRQRSLLAILLAHANELVPADRLADALWEGYPPPTATTALQVHVSRLRKVLETDGDPRLLVTRDPGYLLRIDAEQLDTLRFEGLLAEGRKALAGGDAPTAALVLDEALALWRGPALGDLAELPFGQGWAARLDQLRLAAIEERIEAHIACGRHGEVVAELEALVAREPLRERLWGQLILALYRGGRQADALRAYQRLRAVLTEELGIAPSPELQRLEQAVLRQESALEWAPAPEKVPVPIGPSPCGRTPAGRVPSWAVSRSWNPSATGWRRPLPARGASGPPPGRAGDRQDRHRRGGGCRSPSAGAPGAVGERPRGRGRRAVPALGGGAGDLVPAAGLGSPCRRRRRRSPGPCQSPATAGSGSPSRPRRRPPPLVRDHDGGPRPGGRRGRRAAGARRPPMGRPAVPPAASAPGPAGAPGPHVGPCHLSRRRAHAGQPDHRRPWRPRPSAGHPPHCARRPRSPRRGPVHRAGHRPPRRPAHRFGARQDQRQSLLCSGDGAPAPSGEPAGRPRPVRPGHDGNPRRRAGRGAPSVPPALRGGPPATRKASVLGQEVRVDVLERVSDASEPVVDLLDEAEAAGLLAEDGTRVGCYRFSHDLVRETLYEELSGIRRARLHGRVGAALEALGAGGRNAPWSDLAHHFVMATAGGGDPGPAVDYSVRAAEEATGSLAYEEAVTHYQRALAALGTRGEVRERHTRLLLALGDARWRAGDVAGARATFLDAADAARALPSPELLAEAVLGFGGGLLRAWHATRGAFGDRPGRLLAEALDAVGPEDSALRVRLLGLLAEELYYTANDSRREMLSREAVEMARRLGDPASLALALCSRCLAVWGPDHLEERLDAAREVIRLAEDLGDRQLLAIGRQYQFVAQVEQGDMAAAGATLDAYEALADELRPPLAHWEARRFRALQALVGRFKDAERLALEALAIGQSVEEPDAMAVFGVQLAIVRLEQDRLAELETALRGFVEEFSESPVWRAALALLVLELGGREESRAELERLAEDDFAGLPRNFAWLAGIAMLAQVAHALHDAERAAVLLRLLTPLASRNLVTADRQCWGSAAY